MDQPPPPRPAGVVLLLRTWLIATGVALACFLIWMIAPVLFLLLALTAGLGLVSAIAVKLARKLEAWKQGSQPGNPERS